MGEGEAPKGALLDAGWTAVDGLLAEDEARAVAEALTAAGWPAPVFEVEAAGDVVDSDLLPYSDESLTAGSRTRTIGVGALRAALAGRRRPIRSRLFQR